MIKKLCSWALSLAMITSALPITAVFAEETSTTVYQTEAGYGTPTIDGNLDDWNGANVNLIKKVKGTDSEEYKGWFKLMWDNDNMYVAAKIYSTHYDDSDSAVYKHDSVEFFMDEGCERGTSYDTNDYQLRSNFNGLVSGVNYPIESINVKTSLFDGGYYVEMAFPFKEIKPVAGYKMGFDVQVNEAKTLAFAFKQFGWNDNTGSTYANPSLFGQVTFRKNVATQTVIEPEYVEPVLEKGYTSTTSSTTYDLRENVKVAFDSTNYTTDLLLVDERPTMEIGKLASIVGAELVDGKTLKKDGTEITFVEGDRRAIYKNAHLMLECAPTNYNGKLYVPINFIMQLYLYHLEYNRFDEILKITTGTDYPDAEVVVNVADFGAVGDGVHDDLKPILNAIDAAVGSGKPSKLVFEENKTYLVGERMDCMNIITLEDVDNFTLEGNGSKILQKTSTNNFLMVERCNNIHINNLIYDGIEHTSTQGRITSIGTEAEGTFLLDIDDGYPLPTSNEWAYELYPDERTGDWWFGQIMDPVENRLKFTDCDNCFIESIDLVKDRTYKITLEGSAKSHLKNMAVGDRFVINTRWSAYSVGADTKRGSLSPIQIRYSTDVTLDGVKLYNGGHMMASVGMNYGRISFLNCGFLTRDGHLLCNNSDGIHYWRNRGGLIVKNCTFMNNLDDHINTKAEKSDLLNIEKNEDDESVLIGHWDENAKPGDEFIFYNREGYDFLGRAYLKSWEVVQDGEFKGKYRYTFDRKIEGLRVQGDPGVTYPTMMYDVQSSAIGTVISDSTFMYSRRHAYISRSSSVLFENNYIKDCGGAAVSAANELGTSEGPFPSSFTILGNTIESAGTTTGYSPLEVKHYQSISETAPLGSDAPLDGYVIENNTIDVSSSGTIMLVNSVEDLYMYNNTIKVSKPFKNERFPVLITNCEIKEIDGFKLEVADGISDDDVKTFVNILGCKVDEENVKNVTIPDGSTIKAYEITSVGK